MDRQPGLVIRERGAITEITLDRPEKRNALSLELMRELTAAVQAAAGDVIVLAGNGPCFSAGHDLGEMVGRDAEFYDELFGACVTLMESLHAVRQPVIAKVHGVATAAGCQLVAACDLAVAEEGARFATPGVKIGLFCSTPMVPLSRTIGRKRALQLLLTGAFIDAATAADWGLVNVVVSADRLDAAVGALAEQIVGASPATVGIGKAAFYDQIDRTEPEAYAHTREVMAANAAIADAQEGITAFLEKAGADLDRPLNGLAMAADASVRAAQLRTMKRRATALLVVVTAVFLALAVLADGDATWTGYAIAAAEGSMVGGLADWFAVTALFRHPLGLPIPHTAIIRQRKDQFGETLGSFVQENFLGPDVISDRIAAIEPASRVAAWLQVPDNARTVSRWVLEVSTAAVELVGDDDVHRLLDDEMERAVRSLPVAVLAGKALRAGVADGRHHPLVEAVLTGAMTFLEEQREPLRDRFGQASPWWLPGALEDKVFDRMIDGGRLLLASVVADPEHDLRRQLDQRLAILADRLEHEPELAARGTAVVEDLLASPEVRAWTRQLWGDLTASLRRELDAGPDGRIGSRIALTVVDLGARLAADLGLQHRVEGAVEGAARYVATNHRDEISALVSATVARWDAAETSDKLELLLGRDLQFIRINGTVVGGLAGVAIHGVADLLR